MVIEACWVTLGLVSLAGESQGRSALAAPGRAAGQRLVVGELELFEWVAVVR